MGIREHKQIIERYRKPYRIGMRLPRIAGSSRNTPIYRKNLLLFGKQLHTIQMPDIANEQEQAFMKAMRMMTSTPSWN